MTNLIVGDQSFASIHVLVPHKFNVVGSGRRVLVGSRKHHAQAVVEETLTVGQSEVEL